MNDQTKDPLARWWWPGQWLHIVYGVWIDQLWYWQNVRPNLRTRKDAAILYVQSIFGVLLIVLLLTVIIGGSLQIAGVQIDWRPWAEGAIGLIAFVVVFSSIEAILRRKSINIVDVIVLGLGLGILGGARFNTMRGLSEHDTLRASLDSSEGTITLVIMIMIFGISMGMARGVNDGIRVRIADTFLSDLWMFLIWTVVSGNVVKGLAAGLVFALGACAAGRWSTRQIPDEDKRKQLAKPDGHPPEPSSHTL